MKTLVIVTHPNLNQSRVNKAWKERLLEESNITVHDLYQSYPDENIDVSYEQQLLTTHDRIVFQFPLYWYSTPSLLKKWQDHVLTYGWAYGNSGDQLHGKEAMVVLSSGGPAESYQPDGYNRFTISELLRPLEATINLTGMTYLPPFIFQGVRTKSDNEIAASAEHLVKIMKSIVSDPAKM